MTHDERDRLRCGFGLLGACCLDCSLGPCRIDPFGKKDQHGDCGREPQTIVMKNLLTRLATGSAISANRARQLAIGLSVPGKERVETSPAVIRKVARRLGVEGRDRKKRIAEKALEDFSRLEQAPLNWLKPNVAAERFEVLQKHEVVPHNVDVAISQALGADGELEVLFLTGVRCSLADFNALCIVSDLAAISSADAVQGWCLRRGVSSDNQEAIPRRHSGQGGKMQEARGVKPHIVLNSSLRELLARSILGGELVGAAIFLGCAGVNSREGLIAEEFAKGDILSLFAGCPGEGFHPERCSGAGRSLRGLVGRLGGLIGTDGWCPTIVDLGSCIDIVKVMELAKELSDRHGIDSGSVPLLGVVTEKTDEKIEAMAHWMMALGIPVYWARIPPLLGSAEVTSIYRERMRALFSGYAIWDVGPHELVDVLRARSHSIGVR